MYALVQIPGWRKLFDVLSTLLFYEKRAILLLHFRFSTSRQLWVGLRHAWCQTSPARCMHAAVVFYCSPWRWHQYTYTIGTIYSHTWTCNRVIIFTQVFAVFSANFLPFIEPDANRCKCTQFFTPDVGYSKYAISKFLAESYSHTQNTNI